MKRNLLSLLLCFILLLAASVLFGYSLTLDSWLQWVVELALIAALGFFTYYQQFHKKQLVLSEEELREPVVEHQDFSNSNTWFNYLMGMIVLFILLPSLDFVERITKMYLDGQSWEAIWAFQARVIKMLCSSITFWLLWAILIVSWLRSMLRNARNKYIIEGDTLIIQENFIFKTEEEIRIPIVCIDAVYTSSYWVPNPSLWIKVNGVTRRCYSFPHSIELGKAILKHKQRYGR